MAWVMVAGTAIKVGMSAYEKRRAKKAGASADIEAHNSARDSKELALKQQRDYDLNVKPVGQQMVAEGLSQGRSAAFGRSESVLAAQNAMAKKKLEGSSLGLMGKGAMEFGMTLKGASDRAGLVMEDEKAKREGAVRGAQLLAQKPAYTDTLLNANHNLQGLAEDRADRARGLAMQAQKGLSAGIGGLANAYMKYRKRPGQEEGGKEDYWGIVNKRMKNWWNDTEDGGDGNMGPDAGDAGSGWSSGADDYGGDGYDGADESYGEAGGV